MKVQERLKERDTESKRKGTNWGESTQGKRGDRLYRY